MSGIPERRPPKPEDRSRVEDIDGLLTMEDGENRYTFRQRWIYSDDWRWFGLKMDGITVGWVNCGTVSFHDLPMRVEPLPKRSWLRRLFGR